MQTANKHAFWVTALYLCGMIAERGAVFLMLPFITCHLDPSEFGAYSLLVLSGTVLNYFVVSPPLQALERFFYEPTYEKDRGSLLGSLVLVLVCKALVAATLYSFATALLFQSQGIAVRAYTAVVLLSPVSSMFLLFLQLTERALVCVIVSVLSVVIGSGISIVCLVGYGLGPESLVFGSIVQSGLVVASTLPFVLMEARWCFRWRIVADPLRWGYSLLPAAYSDLILQSGDRYILAGYCGTEAVGIYDLGYRVSSAISLLLSQPAKRGLHPLILKMERNPVAQKRFIRTCALWIYLLGLLLAVALATFSREIIIFVARDSSYWPAWTIVPVIVFAYVQHGIGQFLNYGIVMAKKGSADNICVLFAATSNVLLNLVLIPQFGIIGAAFATLVSFLLWNSLKLLYSWRLYGLTFDLWLMGHASAVALSMVGLAITVDLCARLSPLALTAVKAGCIIGFPVGLCLTGFFTISQLQAVTSLFGSCWSKIVWKSANSGNGLAGQTDVNDQQNRQSHQVAEAGVLR